MSESLDPVDSSTSGLPVLHYFPKFAQIHIHWVSDAIQTSHPLLPASPFACNLSQPQGLFQWVRFRIRWPKYWNFSFSISPSDEYSGLISFKIDWFDLLVVQGTLRSLLQHHNLKASILQCSVYFMVQLQHSYMTTEKKKQQLHYPGSVFISTLPPLLLAYSTFTANLR